MLIRDARWSSNADVVIVGLGGAGAVAAITAHDLGAQVLVIEKQPQNAHHSNTALSGGVFINVADVKKATAYMESLCRSTDGGPPWAGPKVIDVWASYSAENFKLVESLGGKARHLGSGGEHRQFIGWEAIELYRYAGSGLAMQNFLASQVRSWGIQVLYGARVRRLLTSLAGEVEGVRVDLEQEGERKAVDIRAHRAVILTCGGFEFNEEMKL
ncbi:MAG: FAD-binding protein, partial [Dehalococcoidia bacterium]|nr:FAD-binding protein [Dehalococcoidia bacterium]